MIFPGSDWEEAPPESQDVDPAKLDAAVRYLAQNSGRDGVNELVVVRNGTLIWKGSDIDKVHGVWSMTKAFASTVCGLLIDAGKVELQTPAKDHLPSLAGTYPSVTLRHFTTMTSGYRAVGDEPRGTYLHGPSPTPFTPSPTPVFAPPGSHYGYWDSAMNQFGNVLTRIAGEPLRELFKHRIADPIGMHPARWMWGDFGEFEGVVVNGGAGNQGRHVQICAREMARLGHLFLNHGAWRGAQLLSPSWVDEATRAQVPTNLPLGHPASGIDGRGVYGYNWWVNGVTTSGQRKWLSAPPGTYASSGHNNNDMFVIPEWQMVVVRLGLDQDSDGPISDGVYGRFLSMIGESLRD
jgi:CubicO group peptidase (beta-lactamase class C family)